MLIKNNLWVLPYTEHHIPSVATQNVNENSTDTTGILILGGYEFRVRFVSFQFRFPVVRNLYVRHFIASRSMV